MFTIKGLSQEPFAHLFGLPDEELAKHGARRYVVDAKPGFPERVALRDAEIGEALLLVHYEHQSADTPYRASHAVYVSEDPSERFVGVDVVPEVLRSRMLSLRGFDAEGMLRDAELTDGREVETAIARLFANDAIAYIHAHFAKPGCYAAAIART